MKGEQEDSHSPDSSPSTKKGSINDGLLIVPNNVRCLSKTITEHRRMGSTGTTGDESYTTDDEDDVDEPDITIKDHVTRKLFNNHDPGTFGCFSDISTITDKVRHLSVMHRNSSDSSVCSDKYAEELCLDDKNHDSAASSSCSCANASDVSKEPSFIRLQSELKEANQVLQLRDQELSRLSRIRQDVESELEDLTASLFQIFTEWKMNTKRKSRLLRVAEMGTGGGPHSGKQLSDLEERLLSLLSKIHLGDDSLPDSLGGEPIVTHPSVVVEMVEHTYDHDYIKINYQNEEPDLMPESRKDADFNESNDITFTCLENEVEPCSSFQNSTPVETPKSKLTKDYRKKTDSRYTTNLVSEAVQEFKKVQEALVDSTIQNQHAQNKIAEALMNIGSALTTHNIIYEKMAQSQEKIAEAKMISSRALEKMAEAKLISAKAKEKLAEAEVSKYH